MLFALWTGLRWLLCITSRVMFTPISLPTCRDLKTYLYSAGMHRKRVMHNLAALHGPELIHIKTFPENENRHVIDFQLEQLHVIRV